MAHLYRVLVTGSRTWTNTSAVEVPLEEIARKQGLTRLLVVHGDCPTGADAIGKAWAVRLGVEHEPHPPNKALYGIAAYGIRDEEMVKAGAAECLAFIHRCVKPYGCRSGQCHTKRLHGSHGASKTARRLQRAGGPPPAQA